MSEGGDERKETNLKSVHHGSICMGEEGRAVVSLGEEREGEGAGGGRELKMILRNSSLGRGRPSFLPSFHRENRYPLTVS